MPSPLDARRQVLVDDHAHQRDAERRADRARELRQRRRRADRAPTGTEFCTERTKTCIIIPSPIPAMTMFRAASRVRRVRRPSARAAAARCRARPGRSARSAGSGRCARPTGPRGSSWSRAPSMSGVSTTPDEVAEVPITPCTKSGTKLIVPNIAIPTSPIAERRSTATVGLRSRSKGRIGSAHAPLDERETASSSTAATPSAPSTCAERPRVVAPAPDEPEQQRRRAGREHAGAEPVDRVLAASRARRGIVSEDHDERQRRRPAG